MPDQQVIIQFIHPGREYQVSREMKRLSTIPVPWVGGGCNGRCGSSDTGHTRRFVSHEGEYVDGKDKLHTARLGFWTEWEACSTAAAMPSVPQGKTSAKWVHTLKSPLKPTGGKGLNTDPCVFGNTFKYCCCQQTEHGVMRQLAPESLILFGSHLSGQFFLDTVFVVDGEGIPYVTGKTDKLKVSKQYLELSLNRLEKGLEFTFYRGKPFSSASGKPYSFTPVQLFDKSDAHCGERFALDIGAVNRYLTSSSRKLSAGLTQHFKTIHAKPETIVSIWNEIVRQVRAAGFVPGVHFDWPN
jgi:hypothetical protein